MKRDIVFGTLLATATALFLIGDARAQSVAPAGPCPRLAAPLTGLETPRPCPARAVRAERPDGGLFRCNPPTERFGPNDRLRGRCHPRRTAPPARI